MSPASNADMSSGRPILTHLNADSSWLLSLPYPQSAVTKPGRSHWHLLIDPWFVGSQSEVASWMSTQRHVIESSVQSISELNTRIGEFERSDAGSDSNSKPSNEENFVDAVAISYEFTDHCNKETLLEVDPSTPIFAVPAAAKMIKSWNHFQTVVETPTHSGTNNDWRAGSLLPLPSWVGICRLGDPKDAGPYHSGLLIVFNLESNPSSAEAVIYTPHGVFAKTVSHLTDAKPPITLLALLHGLHDIKVLSMQFNLGAHNGLELQRLCDTKYWISTHDEEKEASGIVGYFLRRKVLTLAEALEQEGRGQEKLTLAIDEASKAKFKEVICADVPNGERFVLV